MHIGANNGAPYGAPSPSMWNGHGHLTAQGGVTTPESNAHLPTAQQKYMEAVAARKGGDPYINHGIHDAYDARGATGGPVDPFSHYYYNKFHPNERFAKRKSKGRPGHLRREDGKRHRRRAKKTQRKGEMDYADDSYYAYDDGSGAGGAEHKQHDEYGYHEEGTDSDYYAYHEGEDEEDHHHRSHHGGKKKKKMTEKEQVQ